MSNNMTSMEEFFKPENEETQKVENFFNDESEETPIIDDIYIDEEEFSEDELASRIVSNSCGKDETGLPKGAITLSYERRNNDNSINKVLRSISSNKAELQIQRRLDFIQLDMIFKSAVDSDLKILWNTLERFGRDVNQFSEENSPTFPCLTITVVPVCDKGKYYFVCINPLMWSLTSLTAGTQSNTIRIIFPADQIGFFKDQEIDMTEIESEALRSIENLERQADNIYEKALEKEAYQEERNRQIEELRRSGQY